MEQATVSKKNNYFKNMLSFIKSIGRKLLKKAPFKSITAKLSLPSKKKLTRTVKNSLNSLFCFSKAFKSWSQ
jgi:hypothetical protein